MTNREILEARIAGIETEKLKDVATKAMADPREECDFILDMALDELAKRLGKNDYLKFVESL